MEVYNMSGQLKFRKNFNIPYTTIKMSGDNIIMYNSSQICVMNSRGVQKYAGNVDGTIRDFFKIGWNKYLMVLDTGVSTINSVKGADMNWTWLGLAVLVLLAFSMVDGYRHGFVKEVVSALLVLISVALVWLINPYVNQFIRENTSVYEKIQTASGSFVDSLADGKETMDDEEQKALISSMDIPDLLQKGITENNTALVYQYLAVNTFAGYISGYLANVAVNCLSFWYHTYFPQS